MKKNLLTLLCLITFSLVQAQNVPNGGFETWAGGNPASWLTNNVTSIVTPITQATPAHGGTFALKGEVSTFSSSILPPFLSSTDMSGNGFAVTQAYSTFSFYYKANLTGSNIAVVIIEMDDAGGNSVGSGGTTFGGNISSFTLASVPISYTGSNPVECIIDFTIVDTSGSGSPTVGSYFIIDDLGLSGLASVQENTALANIANVYPNPANHTALVQYNLSSKTEVQFQVMNTQGKMVREILLPEQGTGKHQTDFDVSALPAGFYFVRMKTKDGITFSTLQVAR